MKVLVIGGTKFIGKSIVEKTIENGHEVVLFNRGVTEHFFNVKQIIGDVENIIDFKAEILEQNFDIAVHCISYTEKHAQDILGIFRGTKTRLIVLSSCDCYEAFQGLNRNIDKAEVPIRENSELSSMKYYWSDSQIKGSWAMEYDKNLMTDILIEGFNKKELNVTIFRLPMVYGPGDYQYRGRHGDIIKRILDKRKEIILSDREQCQVYSYGYIENVSSAVVFSFDKGICNGKIYNLGEDYSRSRRRWAELYGKAYNWKFDFKVIPEELIRKDKSYRNASPQHIIIDSSYFSRDTGFKNPVHLEEAIEKTFKYAKENPDVLGKPPNYNEEDELIESYFKHIDLVHSEVVK